MRRCLLALFLASQLPAGAFAGDRTAEVMHFWISGSERAALNVIRSGFEARGGTWIDNPQKDEFKLREILMQRLTIGAAPTAMQWHGNADIREMAETGLIANIDDIAIKGHWDQVLPAALKSLIGYQGHYYLAPTGIHSENWLFYNIHVLADHGIAPPRSWADLLSAAEKLQAAGVTPIAMGQDDWEGRTMWSSVFLGAIGRENFRQMFDDTNASVLEHPEALNAIRTFYRLSRLVGPEATRPKDWTQAVANLANGQAAFQFQGDWAKGELQKLGLVAGRDFGCMLVPGSENALSVVVDAFAFPRSVDNDDSTARNMMATTIMDPEVQIAFNAIKGSVPARLDTPPARLDPCAQISLNQLANPRAAVNPPAQALNTGDFADLEALVHRMMHDPALTPEAALAETKSLLRQIHHP